MITAEELRIGNYVYCFQEDEGFSFLKIDIEDLKLIQEGSILNVDSDFYLTQIQLTEEILLKCGFEYNENKTLLKHNKCNLKLMDIVGLYYRANSPIKADIKHLHQLQNLYFALTNEELKINL